MSSRKKRTNAKGQTCRSEHDSKRTSNEKAEYMAEVP